MTSLNDQEPTVPLRQSSASERLDHVATTPADERESAVASAAVPWSTEEVGDGDDGDDEARESEEVGIASDPSDGVAVRPPRYTQYTRRLSLPACGGMKRVVNEPQSAA